MDDPTARDLPEALYEAMANDGLFDLPPAALARLALSQAARELSDRARSLVPTTADNYTRGGEFIEHALGLVHQANELLERTVIYERARGRSWEAVGEALGITRQSAHERFAEAEERWHDGLDRPYVLPAGSSIVSSNLPDGADSPRDYMRWLDEWCERHVQPADASEGPHQVSAGLVDEEHRTIQLMTAITGQSNRLLSRPGGGDFGLVPHPVAERTFWERKLRLAEALVAERPDDADARRMLTDAQAKLETLRRPALRAVPEDA